MEEVNNLDREQLKFLKIYNYVKNNKQLKDLAEILENDEISKNHLLKEIEIEKEINSLAVSIQNSETLLKLSNNVKKSGKIVRVFMEGVFDIIHSGHFNAIRQGKRLGDILVVGVNSDESVEKAKGPPLMNVHERAALIGACKWVDEVQIDVPYTPTLEILDQLNCDFIAHGDDPCFNEFGEDVYGEMKKKNRFRMFKRTEGISTTDIIGRLLMLNKKGSSDRKGSVDSKGEIVTSNSLLQQEKSTLNRENTETIFDKGPVVSQFLTTGWRLHEFCNDKVPKEGDKVVYIDGSFDILHIGHIETLKAAKAMGDFLYVGVHDDVTINKYRGKNYPILNMQERIFNLLALRYVDDVVIAAPWTVTEDLVKSLKISIVVHGTESKYDDNYSIQQEIDDPYLIPKRLGIYKAIESKYDMNSEILVKRLIKNRDLYVKKFQNKSVKEKDYYKNKEYVNEI